MPLQILESLPFISPDAQSPPKKTRNKVRMTSESRETKHQSRSSSKRQERNFDEVEGVCDFGARLRYPRGRRENQEKEKSEYSVGKGGYDAQQARLIGGMHS